MFPEHGQRFNRAYSPTPGFSLFLIVNLRIEATAYYLWPVRLPSCRDYFTMKHQLLNRLNMGVSQVFSFDVFDTVLTRAVSPPSAVFLLTGQRAVSVLPNHCCPAQFAFVRGEAERRTYMWHGAAASLADIYREVQESLNLSKEQAHQLKRLELDVESEVMYPVPDTCAVIQKLRDKGKSIVFTSDMYLSSDQIRSWLIEYDIWQPEDFLVVSCEHGEFKYNGSLFQPVIDRCGSPERIAHIGNNENADINGARMANIRPCHVTKANSNRYERILEKYARDTGGMGALLAGASRYARLHTEVTSSHEKALREVTAGVMAPILTGFVLWILQCAQKHDLRRLYFTSRDGYILVSMARSLAQAMDYSIDIRYLYLSRAAITAAYPNPTVVRETWDSFEQVSGSDLLARLNLRLEDIAAYLPSEQALKEIMRKPITKTGKEILQRALSRIQENSTHQIDKIAQSRSLLCQYLKQENLGEDVDFGFVDIGWKGTIHGLLNEVLIEEEMTSDSIPGFYFGLNADQQIHAEHRTAYFFDKYRKIGPVDPLPPGAHATLMEMFCTADHGTVTGYHNNESQVKPTLESTWSDRMSAWGFSVVQRTVHSYLEAVILNKDHLNDSDVRAPITKLLQTFWIHPTASEAAAWGNFPREIGQGNELLVKPLAKPYDSLVLVSFARHGEHAHKTLNDYPSWPEASLARSAPWLRRGIRYLLRARGTIKRILLKAKGR